MSNADCKSTDFRRETLVMISAWYSILACLPQTEYYVITNILFVVTYLAEIWILFRHRHGFIKYIQRIGNDKLFSILSGIWLIVLLCEGFVIPDSWYPYISLSAAAISIISLAAAGAIPSRNDE